jgi:formiminotetrahydrofolate cyclodeaminase
MAAALAGMVVSYSIGKKNLAEHDPWLREVDQRLARARGLLLTLATEDEEAYGLVNELMRLPAGDARRERELPEATAKAVAVPSAVLAAAADLLRLFEELAPRSNRMLRSDLGIAAELAVATARGSLWNIGINASMLGEEARARTMADAQAAVARCEQSRNRVAAACRV